MLKTARTLAAMPAIMCTRHRLVQMKVTYSHRYFDVDGCYVIRVLKCPQCGQETQRSDKIGGDE